MNHDSYYAFYGSLRRGMYNYIRFQAHLEYVSTERINGFRLHALSQYPIAVKSKSLDESITVEIFKVTDAYTEKKIHEIELKAGYYLEEMEIRNFKVKIYLVDDPGQNPMIADGDWVKYLTSRISAK